MASGRQPFFDEQQLVEGEGFARPASLVVPKDVEASKILRPSRPAPARTPRVELFCPFDWGLNPYVEIVQAGSISWGERVGLVQSEQQRSVLTRSKIGWLESLVFRSASLDVLQLATDWTTLFCLLDDYVETYRKAPVFLAAYLHRALGALSGESSCPDDAIGTAFADLRGRMLDLAGEKWTTRFVDEVGDIFAAFIWEETNRWKRIKPSYEAHRTMRAITVGLRPQFLLGELAQDAVVSPEVRAKVGVPNLEELTCRSVGWANDIFTYEKEVKYGEVHNLVLVLMDASCIPLDEAIQRAAAIHDKEVRAFLATQAELAPVMHRYDGLEAYVGILRQWIRGHLDWAKETGRYRVDDDGVA
jgi:hypothetical protein